MKPKPIPAEKVQRLMDQIEKSQKMMKQNADQPWPNCMQAVGNAEATLNILLKQLKGEYPI